MDVTDKQLELQNDTTIGSVVEDFVFNQWFIIIGELQTGDDNMSFKASLTFQKSHVILYDWYPNATMDRIVVK